MSNKNEEVLTQEQIDRISDIDYIKEYQGHLPCCDPVDPVVLSSKNADIYMYGKPVNWKDDFYFHTQVIELLRKEKISKIFFPNISSFTGEICEEDDFGRSSKVEKFGFEIFQGKKTEGLVLPKNSAVFLCTADCPVIICQDRTEDLLIVAHAGLGSIIDKSLILHDHKSRLVESVVDDIMDYLDEEDYEARYLEVHIIGGISHESFVYSPDDQVFGEDNKKLLKFIIDKYGSDVVPLGSSHGGISIPNMIKQQLLKWGVRSYEISIDEIDTYTDSRFWSHAEFVKNGSVGIDGRNGILVIHK
jgi:copper oxidase (laccase) domain-containing protein